MDTAANPPVDPISSFVLQKRANVAIALLALAILLVVGGGILLYLSTTANPNYDPKRDSTEKLDDPTSSSLLDPEKKNKPSEAENPNSGPYRVGGGMLLIAALASALCGGYLLNRPQPFSSSEKLAEARALVLTVGGSLGLCLFLAGALLFVVWFDILYQTLVEGKTNADAPMWKPLSALLGAVLGLGLVFLSAQPARAEERNSATIRRLVYSINLVLTLLLVFIGLTVVNVFAVVKLPNQLDTTQSGFFTLDDATRDYLRSLKEDVTIYTMLPEANEWADVRRLMSTFRDANPARVQVKALSPTLDKRGIEELAAKYPNLTKNEFGLLVAVGSDDKKHSFIRAEELFTRDVTANGTKTLIVGESRVIREILFLTEAGAKPVVYFTQGAGEIAIEKKVDAELGSTARPGEQLKAALTKDGCDVKVWKPDPLAADVKVPDDATILVVADPKSPLSPATVNAIGKYLSPTESTAKKGKLIYLQGAHPRAGEPKGIVQSGLETVLMGFGGIRLLDRVMYAMPSENSPPNAHFVRIHEPAFNDRNLIALAFQRSMLQATDIRPIGVPPPQRGVPNKYTPQVLFRTFEDRATWFESEVPPVPFKAAQEVIAALQAGRREILREKSIDLDGNPKGVAVTVTEKNDEGQQVARLVVYGFGDFFVDGAVRSSESTSINGELMAATVNWLRDRPAVANVTPKSLGLYRANPTINWTSAFWLPVGATLLLIVAGGLGIWAVRRK